MQIICTFVSIAISGVDLCFTGLYDYLKPSIVLYGYIMSAVSLTNVSPIRLTLLLESSATGKGIGVGQKIWTYNKNFFKKKKKDNIHFQGKYM